MPSPRPLLARRQIDAALEAVGWAVQGHALANLSAGPGVALREFPIKQGRGRERAL